MTTSTAWRPPRHAAPKASRSRRGPAASPGGVIRSTMDVPGGSPRRVMLRATRAMGFAFGGELASTVLAIGRVHALDVSRLPGGVAVVRASAADAGEHEDRPQTSRDFVWARRAAVTTSECAWRRQPDMRSAGDPHAGARRRSDLSLTRRERAGGRESCTRNPARKRRYRPYLARVASVGRGRGIAGGAGREKPAGGPDGVTRRDPRTA